MVGVWAPRSSLCLWVEVTRPSAARVLLGSCRKGCEQSTKVLGREDITLIFICPALPGAQHRNGAILMERDWGEQSWSHPGCVLGALLALGSP